MSRIGIAVWNYREPGKSLRNLVSEFADIGFSAMSFNQPSIIQLSDPEADELRRLLDERDLIATVHGACRITADDVRIIADRLGDRLRSFTMDARKTTDSTGTFFDAAAMSLVLRDVSRILDGVPYGIEDFPLDDQAVAAYEDYLTEFMSDPSYGILVDVGHMNMRCTREGSVFQGMSPLEYLSLIPLPIIEVHLHDNMGEKDSHGHFGFGNVDFAAVAKALKEVGFDGISTIEIAPSFHAGTPRESWPHVKPSLDTWRSLWESVHDG